MTLDAMLKRFARVPTPGLARAGSQEMKERWARADLNARGIKLKGDKTAIRELIRYEIEHREKLLQGCDECIATVLSYRSDGRPNAHSALRDLLIFSYNRLVQLDVSSSDAGAMRVARRATAKFFGLTSDTRTTRSRRLSTDQVKWAEERTFSRFERVRHLDDGRLIELASLSALHVLGSYFEELAGNLVNASAFEKNIANLTDLCRTIDAAEHAARLCARDARLSNRVAPGTIQRKLN
jgi:hypothetical protein